ncbi:hypothetical protein F2Q69_00052944 [Brassica cretica]|uniref:Uncharacterized protein n=1 Tax=Brassica cretica TaxID=69181 RepID=A0A8S9MZZ4_BRACR|nr:hypothetical protein F2Q69_00052944 [Brassica cretica]
MEQGVLNHILLFLESEHHYAACWALMLALAFFGGRKWFPFAAECAAFLHEGERCCHSERTQEEEKEKNNRNLRGWLKGKYSVIGRLVESQTRSDGILPDKQAMRVRTFLDIFLGNQRPAFSQRGTTVQRNEMEGLESKKSTATTSSARRKADEEEKNSTLPKTYEAYSDESSCPEVYTTSYT